MFRKWIVTLTMPLVSKLPRHSNHNYPLASRFLTVQASHSQLAEIAFVKLLMYAFRKWIVMYATACESKLSRAVAYITIRLPELLTNVLTKIYLKSMMS